MNFLSFRDNIYDWTLDTDEKLFNQVNQLTDYIFQTQKVINQSIVITKANLNQSSTILNNNFNHYLRLSQTKFTQNKIAQAKRPIQQAVRKEQTVPEQKTKMQIYKEALNISLKNLQIKEEEKQSDNVSVSQMSLSQAIFKNARLPPYFGSKQFRAQKFLNLFFDQDLQQSAYMRKQIQSLSNQPLSTPSQNISSIIPNLAPPPSLSTLDLTNNYNIPFSGSLLPPPPPPPPLGLSLPPPPPLSAILLSLPTISLPPSMGYQPSGVPSLSADFSLPQRVLIDERDDNKAFLETIITATRPVSNQQSQVRTSFVQPHQQLSKPIENKPMSFQEELALKLKLGKNFKAPSKTVVVAQTQNQTNFESQPIIQRKQQQTLTQKQKSFRQSTRIEEIIGSSGGFGSNNKSAKKQSTSSFFAEQDEEQENTLFGSSKRKPPAQTNNNTQSTSGSAKNDADIMMSRSTFNEDMLFKKKPVFSKQTVISAKTQQKARQKQQKKQNRASMLFNQDSDEQQENFTFKKKTVKTTKVQQKKTQEQSPKKKEQHKTSNPLGLALKTQTSAKTSNQVNKKKPINKLFGGDSDQEEDIFAKKKPISKKQIQSPSKSTQNQLKPAQKAPQKTQSISEKAIKVANPLQSSKPLPKKSSLFGDDDEDEDFSFKPKSKSTKTLSKGQEQQKQIIESKQQSPEKELQVNLQKIQSTKAKNSMFSVIHEQQNEDEQKVRPLKTKPAQQNKQQIEETAHVTQQESQQVKRMKKIARMGGQAMMGMAQLLPKANVATSALQTQQSQKTTQRQKQQSLNTQQPIKQNIFKQQSQIQPQPQTNNQPTQIIKAEDKQEVIQIRPTQMITQQKPKIQQTNIYQQLQVPKKEQEIQQQSLSGGLSVRRRKNKPKRTSQDIFDQEQKDKNKKTVLVTTLQQPKMREKQQLYSPAVSIKPKNQKQSYIQKMSRMGMMGMSMPGIMPAMGGLGPLLPKGMIITKPSEAKKMQQEALQRLRLQQEKRIQEQRQQRQKQRVRQAQKATNQREQQRIRQGQLQRQENIRQQEQLLRYTQIQEEQERQRLIQDQKQIQRLLALQEEQDRRRVALQEEQNKRLVQEEQNRRRNAVQEEQSRRRAQEEQSRRVQKEQIRRIALQEEYNLRRLAAQQQQRKRIEQQQRSQTEKRQKPALPGLPIFDLGNKKQAPNPLLLNKKNNSGPLDVPKLPPKTNPLGGLSKSPLNTPLSGTLGGNTQKFNPLPVPSMPVVNKEVSKNAGKRTLFDDDEDEADSFAKKKEVILPSKNVSVNNKQKKKPSLFDDDDDDSGFAIKPKTKKNTTNKKGLFNDDDDDDQGFGKKKQTIKQTVKPPTTYFKVQQQVTTKSPSHPGKVSQKQKNKKGLFGDSDSQEDNGFGRKKVQTKNIQSNLPVANNFGEKTQIKATKQTKNKKNLFGQSDDHDDVIKKKPVKKQQAPKLLAYNQPIIPTKNTSPDPLPTSKTSNPLGGLSSGPLSGASQPKIQQSSQPPIPVPVKTNPLALKKRNIFEQSQEQSPTIPRTNKQKITQQQQQPQKKGLISEGSQEQKPPKKHKQIINVMPVQQEQTQYVQPTNNNRKLFDDSDDSDEKQMQKKRRNAANKLKKLF